MTHFQKKKEQNKKEETCNYPHNFCHCLPEVIFLSFFFEIQIKKFCESYPTSFYALSIWDTKK